MFLVKQESDFSQLDEKAQLTKNEVATISRRKVSILMMSAFQPGPNSAALVNEQKRLGPLLLLYERGRG